MDSIKIGKVTFIHGDCMEYLEGLDAGAYDLAIVDPPYGIGISSNMGRRKGDKKSNYKPVKWDESTPNELYFKNLTRVSNKYIIWGGNYFTNYLPPTNSWIIWHKMNDGVSFSMGEMAYTNLSINCKIYKHLNKYNNRIHPTQKPVQLYKWLLINYAKEGQTILDTHGGSGSIAIACHELGFELTIIEKDKEYFDNMVQRFKTHIKQLKLF